jgi:hypothetical protein
VGTGKLSCISHELLHTRSVGAVLADALSAIGFLCGSHYGSGLWDVVSK